MSNYMMIYLFFIFKQCLHLKTLFVSLVYIDYFEFIILI